MKRIATLVNEQGQVVGMVHGPDATGQSITVKGRKWFFDFDNRFGPLWLRKDLHSPRKCQCPKKEVWDQFSQWLKAWRKRHKP